MPYLVDSQVCTFGVGLGFQISSSEDELNCRGKISQRFLGFVLAILSARLGSIGPVSQPSLGFLPQAELKCSLCGIIRRN